MTRQQQLRSLTFFPRADPQTYPQLWFYLALLVGYGGFVFWLGLRWIVLMSGALVIAVAVVYEWCSAARSPALPETHHDNLLDPAAFEHHLSEQIASLRLNQAIENQTDAADPLANSQQQQQLINLFTADIKLIQRLAADIAQQEPTLTPDLIDTLHSVVALGSQFAVALRTADRVKTPEYEAIAQQQLSTSQARLKQTHDQLRSLHDQLLIEGLPAFSETATLSTRLQMLTVQNQNGLTQN